MKSLGDREFYLNMEAGANFVSYLLYDSVHGPFYYFGSKRPSDIALYVNGTRDWGDLDTISAVISFVRHELEVQNKYKYKPERKQISFTNLQRAIKNSCDVYGNDLLWNITEHCEFEEPLDMHGFVVTPLSMYMQNISGSCIFYVASGEFHNVVMNFADLEVDAKNCKKVIISPFNSASVRNVQITGRIILKNVEGDIDFYKVAVNFVGNEDDSTFSNLELVDSGG